MTPIPAPESESEGGQLPEADDLDQASEAGRRIDRVVFRIAVAIAASPIVISVIRNGLMGWYPSRDAALTAVYVNDVFTAHTPLVGLAASFSRGNPSQFSYLGPIHMDLLAVPVKLLGVSWGLLVGMGILNTTWFVLAMWLIRRRVGYRVGLIGCVVGASLVWALGSQVLIDPTPVQTGTLAFFACCVAAWSVADRDPAGVIPLAICANYLFLTHPKYVLVVPALALFAFVIWAWRLYRLRSRQPERWLDEWPRQRRSVIGASVIVALMWAAPVIEQLTRPGGNIRAWVTSMATQSERSEHQISQVIQITSSTLATWPLWLRDSAANPNFTIYGPTISMTRTVIGLSVVAAIGLVVGVLAGRRRDTTTVLALGAAALAWSSWTLTVSRTPKRTYNLHYLLTLWPLAAFVWLAILVGVARSVTHLLSTGSGRSPGPPKASVTQATLLGYRASTVALIAVLAVAAIPIANFNSGTPQGNIPNSQSIRRAIKAKVPPRRTGARDRAALPIAQVPPRYRSDVAGDGDPCTRLNWVGLDRLPIIPRLSPRPTRRNPGIAYRERPARDLAERQAHRQWCQTAR